MPPWHTISRNEVESGADRWRSAPHRPHHAGGTAFCRRELTRLAIVVITKVPTMMPSESGVEISGTDRCSPPLMNGRVFSCNACSTNLTPMKARMNAVSYTHLTLPTM